MIENISTVDLAYIAGFFDGEGSAYVCGPYSKYPHLRAKIAQNETEVLYWIADLYGFGKIYSKGKDSSNSYIVFAHRQARLFLTSIEPFLRVKKEHVFNLLNEFGREVDYGPSKGKIWF